MSDVYQSVQRGRAAMRLNQDAIVEHLVANPKSMLHEKIAMQLEQGVGGEDLAHHFSPILNALNDSALRSLLEKMPTAKLQMFLNHVEQGFDHVTEVACDVVNSRDTRLSATQDATPTWWAEGNTLALVQAMRVHATVEDSGFSGPTHEALNSHLIGAARVIGMSEEDIREAFESDRGLTIYEP